MKKSQSSVLPARDAPGEVSQEMPWSVVVYLDAVLFDADAVWRSVSSGVLADYHVAAADRLPDSLILALSTGDLQRISTALTEVVASRSGRQVTTELMRLRIHRHLVQELSGDVALRADTRAFLHQILRSGARVAFISSLPRSWVERLSRILVLPRPHLLLTADEVRIGRPDPYGYLLAAHQLGVPARYGIAVESGADGIRAAMDAGYRVVAIVPTEMTGGSGRLRLVSELAEIDLGQAHAALLRSWHQEKQALA